jgi:hypothetical protein
MCMCCFPTKHAALRSKGKFWLVRTNGGLLLQLIDTAHWACWLSTKRHHHFNILSKMVPTWDIYIYSEWLLFNAKSAAMFQLYHGENKLFFIEIIMRSALYKTNKPSAFSMVLPHWNNSPLMHMLPHSVTLSRFRTSQTLLFQLKAFYFWEAMNTNCIVFGLTRWGLEPMIYRTRGENTNQRSGYIHDYGVDIGLSDWTVVYLMCKLECCKTFVTSNS